MYGSNSLAPAIATPRGVKSVENADGFAVGFEHLGEALVGKWGDSSTPPPRRTTLDLLEDQS